MQNADAIHAIFAPNICWQIPLSLPPLTIAQPNHVASHRLCSESLEQKHQPIQTTTLLLGLAPNSAAADHRWHLP
jgi:hypothetical protein